MVDRYLGYWIIASADGLKWMQFCKFSENNVEMEIVENCDNPIRLNTKRDCIMLLQSLRYQVDDYKFKEYIGAVTPS
jgi:hypothetical protein